ncbi:MAG: TIGR02677 family protein [Phycisphaeraceae bacterium]
MSRGTDYSDGFGPDPPSGGVNRWMAFQHVRAGKPELYRAMMRQFIEATGQFKLHLRPAQVHAALAAAGATRLDRLEVERALDQLCDWGNLEKHLDTDEVSSVKEFLRPRFLYQITETGQAVERALQVFVQALNEAGELQTTTLHEIREELEGLLRAVGQATIDDGEAFRQLDILRSRFEQLTARAQTFLSSLQRTTQLQDVDLNAFMSYKQALIDYLKRFIAELATTSPQIADLIERIESAGIDRLLEAAARRELRDAVLPPDDERRAAVVEQWRRRWKGLRGWFIASEGERAQEQELRAHARAAIPALLRAVGMLHERRITRSDRSADLRTLARWFAETDDDREAHQLWRAAFGLAPARHLRVDQDTLDAWEQEPVRASTPWCDAPPLRVSPRLRKTGRTRRPGPAARVIDRRKEKAALARFAAEEARQLAAARSVLATGRATRLSRLGELDTPAFELFLELLGEALAHRASMAGPVEATSADGTLSIHLEPTDDGVAASVKTPAGRFVGEDHHILIRETDASGEASAATPPPASDAISVGQQEVTDG